MKKLLLFLTVLTFGISFSSCLKMDNTFTDPYNIVYIGEYSSTIKYGKTQTGKLITSNEMQTMENKSMHLLSYTWDEKKNGTTTVGAATAFEVDIIGKKAITKTFLYPGSHSEKSDLFKKTANPVRDEFGIYFDDVWVFDYAFEAIEGQHSTVSFFLREEDNSEESNINSKKTVKVDIHLSIDGTPREGVKEKKLMGDLVAVDLSDIRRRFVNESKKDVEIKFYYYDEEGAEPAEIKGAKMIYVEENKQ